jgi:hypothetical protein
MEVSDSRAYRSQSAVRVAACYFKNAWQSCFSSCPCLVAEVTPEAVCAVNRTSLLADNANLRERNRRLPQHVRDVGRPAQ